MTDSEKLTPEQWNRKRAALVRVPARCIVCGSQDTQETADTCPRIADCGLRYRIDRRPHAEDN